MGTRADFYAGRGKDAEWLGSIAWDGYPEGIPGSILHAETEDGYREVVGWFLQGRDDASLPERDGWPWSWTDSGTTDYAYAFDGGKVWTSCFGSEWFDPLVEVDYDALEADAAEFPDMSDRQHVAWAGVRSGLTVITGWVKERGE